MTNYIQFPDGTRCYTGFNCRRHAPQIAALSAPASITGPESFEQALAQADRPEVVEPVVPLAKGLKPREIAADESRTYADILRSGDKGSRVVTSVDMSTPPGYFVTSVKMLGITTEYLLDGTEGDKNAKIVGRIELVKARGHIYRGSDFKGGQYLGGIGENSDKTFEEAFDDITIKPEPIPVAPKSTPTPYGEPLGSATREQAYNPNSYSDHAPNIVKQVRTNSEFRKAIRQLRAEPNGGIRVVEVDFGKRFGHFSEKPVVHAPKDGTPLVIDYVNGYTDLEIAEGNVVINATATYGGGVTVRQGASATIISPHGKFTVEAEAGSAVTVYPRSGARGGIWADEGANVTLDDLYEHDIKVYTRKTR